MRRKNREFSEYSKRQKMYNQSEEYKEKQRTNKQRKRFDPDIMDKEKVHKQSEEYKEKQRANQQRKRFVPDIRKKDKENVYKQNEEYKEKQRAKEERKEKAKFRNKYHLKLSFKCIKRTAIFLLLL